MVLPIENIKIIEEKMKIITLRENLLPIHTIPFWPISALTKSWYTTFF